MVLSITTVKGILLAANVLALLPIAVRLIWQRRHRQGPGDLRERGSPAALPSSRRAGKALMLGMLATGGCYLLLALWWLDPRLAGPRVLPLCLPLQVAGSVLIVLGLLGMAWSLAVFRSWRLRAQIDPGHQLVTGGPFALVRHPIYSAMNLLCIGTFLLLPHVAFLLLTFANAWAHNVRARLEERVLLRSFGNEYQRYMQRTRRLIPWVY